MPTMATRDAKAGGVLADGVPLSASRARMTVRQLIFSRVAEEVRDHNGALALGRVGPVGSGPVERVLTGGGAYGRGRWLDFERECARALSAFLDGRLVVLVDRRLVANLDAEVDVLPETVVSFVRTAPRVGHVAV